MQVYSNNIITDKSETSLVELLIERVELLEEDVRKLKVQVNDLTTGRQQLKNMNLTPASNIVTISDDEDNIDKRITTTSRSPYQRSEKGKSVINEGSELVKSGKRLFNTPPSAQKPIKKSKASSSVSPTVKNYCNKVMTQASKPRGHTIPKEVKSCFRPSPVMDLTWEESRLSAYIFNDQLDLNENLFMIGDETGTRREFLSLATGRDINDKASIFDKVLDQPQYEMEMKYFPKNLSSWEIKNGDGIPNLWNSRNSATWVIQWLEMEDSFMSTVIGEV
ncbi:hypothetical protein Lal_00032342 [Lupinus albus]|nr:hypothetical protein Lal_00032342 [Lupinus albus]